MEALTDVKQHCDLNLLLDFFTTQSFGFGRIYIVTKIVDYQLKIVI